MKLLDKIKIALWLNKEVGKMEKLKGLWSKLDGMKSIAGLLAIVAYYALPQFGVQVPDVVLKVGSGMAGVGLLHKLEKGTAILSKVIDILSKVSSVAKSTEDKLKEKEGDGK